MPSGACETRFGKIRQHFFTYETLTGLFFVTKSVDSFACDARMYVTRTYLRADIF